MSSNKTILLNNSTPCIEVLRNFFCILYPRRAKVYGHNYLLKTLKSREMKQSVFFNFLLMLLFLVHDTKHKIDEKNVTTSIKTHQPEGLQESNYNISHNEKWLLQTIEKLIAFWSSCLKWILSTLVRGKGQRKKKNSNHLCMWWTANAMKAFSVNTAKDWPGLFAGHQYHSEVTGNSLFHYSWTLVIGR